MAAPGAAETALELARGSAFSGQSLWRLTPDDRLQIVETGPRRPGKRQRSAETLHTAPGTFAAARAWLLAHPIRVKPRGVCLDYGTDSIRLSGPGPEIRYDSPCPDAGLDALDAALRRLIRP